MQKNAADLIDDTQVGLTNLHQDINYRLGRVATQSLYYQRPLARGGRAYVSFNHTYAVNKGCETQLLAPCFGSPTDWTPADHEQRWGATGGFVVNDRRGGWLSLDGEYGSGLSSGACPSYLVGFCKRTPHLTFDLLKGRRRSSRRDRDGCDSQRAQRQILRHLVERAGQPRCASEDVRAGTAGGRASLARACRACR
jgi:hypothetical protein